VYDFSGGETLVSIANTYLIPAVTADIVAAYNGLDAMQASPIFAFPAGESVAVPASKSMPTSALTLKKVNSKFAPAPACHTAPVKPKK
jgi:hypothetical protein